MKITGQHVVGFLAVLAVLTLINTFVGPHWFGWGASAPVVATGGEDVVKAISGLERNLSAEIGAVNETANAALATAIKANQTASTTSSSKTTSLVIPAGGQTSSQTSVPTEASAGTMDHEALETAKQYLADAESLYESAQVADDNMDEAIDDEDESDVEDYKDEAKDIVDDANDIRDDAKKLQDKLRVNWPSEARNTTVKNQALRVLDSARTTANDAKKDAQDVIDNADEYLNPSEEEKDTTPQVVYVQTPVAGQTTATGVAGYQSQTEGL